MKLKNLGRAAMPLIAGLLVWSCGQVSEVAETGHSFDRAHAIDSLRILSADDMEGRDAGSAGGARARAYLLAEFERLGLEVLREGYEYPFEFTYTRRGSEAELQGNGVNLVALVRGTAPASNSAPVIVVTAHYDHVGVIEGEIYNGTDDNASGTVAALAIAESLMTKRPVHDVVIALVDAEEKGLRGAREFVTNPPTLERCIGFNLNFDMVSRSDASELYAVGTHHYPALKPVVEAVATGASVKLLMGHDLPGTGGDDWTFASDHGPFHQAGIPFLYLGVEDHADYHQASDEFDKVRPTFFLAAIVTAEMTLREIDSILGDIASHCD